MSTSSESRVTSEIVAKQVHVDVLPCYVVVVKNFLATKEGVPSQSVICSYLFTACNN